MMWGRKKVRRQKLFRRKELPLKGSWEDINSDFNFLTFSLGLVWLLCRRCEQQMLLDFEIRATGSFLFTYFLVS